MSKPEEDYHVGKGRPPKHTQFKKGQSGNPSGKKKRRTFDDEIIELSDDEIEVVVQGRSTMMTFRRAIALKVLTKAMHGDLRAIAVFRTSEAANDNRSDDQDEAVASPGSEGLIERFFQRYARRRSGSGPEPDDV